MNLVKCGQFLVTVKRSRMQPNQYGGKTRVYDAPTQESVELFMDTAALIQALGQKACLNKNKRASYLHGMIVVKAVK